MGKKKKRGERCVFLLLCCRCVFCDDLDYNCIIIQDYHRTTAQNWPMGCSLAVEKVYITVEDDATYFRSLVQDKEDLENCRKIWAKILVNDTPPFARKICNARFPYASCSDWFSAVLYDNLFSRCPHARRMFSSNITQTSNRSIVKMISKCLFLMENLAQSCGYNTSRIMPPSPSSGHQRLNSDGTNGLFSAISEEPDTAVPPGVRSFDSFDPDMFDINSTKMDQRVSSFPLVSDQRVTCPYVEAGPKTVAVTEVFCKQMKHIATSHHNMGVKARDFCHFGDALMAALRTVCGESVFTPSAELSWRKLYTAMLRAIMDNSPEPFHGVDNESCH
jgi:hypothetical protein